MNIVHLEDGTEALKNDSVSAQRLLLKDEVETVHLEIAPGGSLPVHTTPVEVFFYVLEGRGEIEIGDERQSVEADMLIESPKAIRHGLHNTGNATFRVLVVKTPRPR